MNKVIAETPDVIIIAIMGSETGIACSPSTATFAETLAIMADLIHPELNSATIL